MKTVTRNFHIPMPEQLYLRLKKTAHRQRRSATQLVTLAVEYWLNEQEKLALYDDISAYAAQTAGTKADLDRSLESAGLEQLATSHHARNRLAEECAKLDPASEKAMAEGGIEVESDRSE